MFQKPPSPEQYDTLGDTAAYARPVEDFGAEELTGTPLEHLVKLRKMLIDKRRYLAQDAMVYPVTYLGRAQDIAELQELLHALDEAIEHENELASGNGI
jgi:hypothetical protein